MPLDWTNIELVLRGMAQKSSDLTRAPDHLKYAINVEFDKDGDLNKRRGYQFVDLGNTVNAFDDDAVFCNVGTYRDELVVFSYDYVAALGSRDSQLRGSDALVYRGPSNRGAGKLQYVSTSETSISARPSDAGTFLAIDNRTFAAHEQADVAALQADGVFYRCYVYLNRAAWRIEAVCFVEQAHGQWSVVFQNIVRALDQTQLDDGEILDSPKIIAVGTTFVVHWIQSDGVVELGESNPRDLDLHRSTMDMTAFSAATFGWTYRNSVGLYFDGLYDVCPVLGSDTDFVVARKDMETTFRVERFDGFDWLDTDWQTDVAQEIAPRVLGVYAHDDDNDVVCSYVPSAAGADRLMSCHLDADDGGSFTQVETFNLFPDADFVQVGHCRVAANRVVVVAEARTMDNGNSSLDPMHFLHHVVYRQINSGTANRIGREHWAAHLSMCSRPWSYASGTSTTNPTPNVYVVLSHKSIADPSDLPAAVQTELEDDSGAVVQPTRAGSWREAYIFACNLDFRLWDAGAASVRPRPIVTLSSVGIPDARPSGQCDGIGQGAEGIHANIFGGGPSKRMNHISYPSAAPPFGPDVKTRTAAIGIFARMGTTQREGLSVFEPENAGIVGLRVYMEDPWTMHRDGSDPEQPVDNFLGAYPRPMFQSVEAGKALVIAGGTPAIYAGRQVVELGYPWSEIILAQAQTGNATWPSELGAGGVAGTGTYSWYIVPTWRDEAGQYHRGPPSNIVTLTLSASQDIVFLRARTITTSLKDNEAHYPMAPRITFEVYRTEADGAIFYREWGGTPADVADPEFPSALTPVNDPTADYVDIPSGLADTNLILRGAAPFTIGPGGFEELTPQVVPALSSLILWQGRLCGIDQLDESLVWYSDQILPEFASDYYRAPEFNDTNTFRVDGIGELVALKPMANECIAWTRAGLYAIQGEGNDGLGEGANLQLSTLHEGTGCIDPRSLVLAPPGIFFQSHKGYYLLNRNKSLDYVTAGEKVEDDVREAGNIRAATLLEDRHQIRLVCNGRPVTTWTTVWTVATSEEPQGEWQITATGFDGVGQIAFVEADNENDAEQIANALAVDIQALIADGTLRDVIVSATPNIVSGQLEVVWAPDVVPSYSDSSPGGNNLSAVDTSDMEVQPRVLLLDYRALQWSRANMVDVSTTERLNECVAGCAWRGVEGGTAHVVLHQGGLHIERGPRDATPYADETSTGTVGIPIDLLLTPFHPAGFAGYQRLRSCGIQAHKPNFSEYSVDLHYYTSGDFQRPDAIDEDVAVETVSPAYSRVRPRIQQAAIGLRIYEAPSVAARENIKVTGLVWEVGMKKGPRRVSNAQIAR